MAATRSIGGIVLSAGVAVVAVLVLVLFAGLAWRIMAPPEPHIPPTRTDDHEEILGETVQVQILNGAGIPGAARAFTLHLRQRGFDVVESGDRRPFDTEQTHVIDRIGNRDAAVRVARVLGLAEDAVVEDINLGLYVHATVVIGRDYPTSTTVSPDALP
jgi:hypothetical protein